MGLRTFVIRRILLMIPTLVGVSLLIFAVTQLFSPPQRASLFVTNIKAARDIGPIIEKYHLNDNLYVQYYYWLSAVLKGNLGWSTIARMPVSNAILQAAPASIELVICSIPITILLGIWLGVKSAVNKDKAVDHATRMGAIIGWSLPTFWLGLLLLAFFAGFGWIGMGRVGHAADTVIRSSQWTDYTGLYIVDGLLNGEFWITLEALQHIVLPTVTLTVGGIALIVRVMRSSMLEALHKGFITTARAKGLAQKEVANKHARRNALIPVITLSGLVAAGLLTGVVITESVFQFKGMGYLAARAALALDIPMIVGFSLFTGIIFTVANLIVDIIYAYLDPRIRLG